MSTNALLPLKAKPSPKALRKANTRAEVKRLRYEYRRLAREYDRLALDYEFKCYVGLPYT